MNIFRSKISEQYEALKATHESLVESTKDYSQLQEQVISLTQEKAQLFDELQALKSSLVEKEKEIETVETTLTEQIEEKEEHIIEVLKEQATVEEIATQKSVELLAQLGVDAVEVLDDTAKEELTKKELSVVDTYLSLSGQERTDFYKKNKKSILSAFSKNK